MHTPSSIPFGSSCCAAINNDHRTSRWARPTVATLRVLRLFDITPDATTDSVATPDTYIQLPTIDLQRAQTTVRMPDRGHLIVAGLKNTIDRDLSSSTPFLSKIPIISWLFARKGKSIEKKNLIVIISSEILDLADIERNTAFGRMPFRSHERAPSRDGFSGAWEKPGLRRGRFLSDSDPFITMLVKPHEPPHRASPSPGRLHRRRARAAGKRSFGRRAERPAWGRVPRSVLRGPT